MFRKKQNRVPDTPQVYPEGSCVRTEKATYYILDGKKCPAISERAVQSWNFPRIIVSSEAALSKYPRAGKLGFRNGTLLHDFSDGRIYLVVDNKRRHIKSPDVLDKIGATHKEIITVSAAEIRAHREGEPLFR